MKLVSNKWEIFSLNGRSTVVFSNSCFAAVQVLAQFDRKRQIQVVSKTTEPPEKLYKTIKLSDTAADYCELGDLPPRSPLEPVCEDGPFGPVKEERKRTPHELRELWKKAIIQQILLLRMEKENQKLQGMPSSPHGAVGIQGLLAVLGLVIAERAEHRTVCEGITCAARNSHTALNQPFFQKHKQKEQTLVYMASGVCSMSENAKNNSQILGRQAEFGSTHEYDLEKPASIKSKYQIPKEAHKTISSTNKRVLLLTYQGKGIANHTKAGQEWKHRTEPVQKSKLSYLVRLGLLNLKVNMNLKDDTHEKLIQKGINDSRERPC
ncbi:hypothetical protein EK904_011171 [Melospiza melodia maxima]|nr:hypothetical protein EK904_011171 [Melospiza melodia maxima]